MVDFGELPTEMTVTCPVCDAEVAFTSKEKTWYGYCVNCTTRIYTTFPAMRAILKEAALDAGTTAK